ncbi:focal adhesion protein tensin [Musca autumnalis]|uniref:focal adhesion protein tensin n=1 Tax=Musca autumnalis TaxID=221902 RepID=UPI003CECC1E0
MRSHYDEYARSETKNTTTTTNYNKMLNTNNNNYNSHYNYNSNSNNNNNDNSNGSIPYHARENSLPFSYGQISKTSTPLRPTTATASAAATTSSSFAAGSAAPVSRSYKNGVEHDLDFDFDFGLSSERNNNSNRNYNNHSNDAGYLGGYAKTSNGLNGNSFNLTNSSASERAKKRIEFFDNSGDGVGCTQTLNYKTSSSAASNEVDPSMIKVQPRLTSPLLVRKTLGGSNSNSNNNTNASSYSRSPTRSSTNTIANTYHYSYGNKNSSSDGGRGGRDGVRGDIGDNNFDKFVVNGNISNNIGSGSSSIYGRNTPTYGGDTLSKTPARHDFDELLRERREKVFSEYRSTTQEVMRGTPTPPNRSPLPPPRRFVNGTVQLPSTLPPSLNGGRGSSLSSYSQGPQVPQRNPGKYNYDFQFNLNLDAGRNGHRREDEDDDDDQVDYLKSRQHSHTLDRSPQRYRSNEDYDARRHQTLDRYTTTTSTQQQQRYQDETDGDILRRRPDAKRSYGEYQEKQQQQQLYETRNIPLASYNVERNYHTTTTSSSASAHNPQAISPNSMSSDIYATPYDDERHQYASSSNSHHHHNNNNIGKATPLEANNNNNLTSITSTSTTLRTNRYDQQQQQQQQAQQHQPTPYGNGQIYGQQQQQQQYHETTTTNTINNIGQAATTPQMARRRESSPIYATSTKKVTTSQATAPTPLYGSTTPQQPGQSYQQQHGSAGVTTSMATLSITDYQASSPSGPLRPETPAFPVTPRTPFGTSTLASSYNSNTLRSNGYAPQQHHNSATAAEIQNYSTETIYGTNYRPRLNSSLSMANSEPQEVAAHLVKFAKDSSKFWYKPNLSREEAISLLINAAPGTFVVRDSTTYKNAYGLVLRVAQPPPGTTSTGKPDELVRHFLIEPTTRGVRLKGCANEPVFTSLSALVYEHSINQLALPCLLQIPERDIVQPLIEPSPAQTQLLTQGAACNVLWLFSCDTESLTGEEAIRKAIRQMNAPGNQVTPTEVHFKVSHQGITLTDNTRKKFFRKHYTADIISYCAIDPDHRLWTMQEHGSDNTTVVGALKKTIFAFVARRSASSKDNQCHVFCDLAINQPASAIVSFVNKTLPTEKQKNYIL